VNARSINTAVVLRTDSASSQNIYYVHFWLLCCRGECLWLQPDRKLQEHDLMMRPSQQQPVVLLFLVR